MTDNKEEIPISCLVDPHNKFWHLDDMTMMNLLGSVLGWAGNKLYEDLDLRKSLVTQYKFNMDEWDNCKITHSGVLKFSSDPDQYPLLMAIRGNETLYQYDNAIVGIVQEDGSSFVCRMD